MNPRTFGLVFGLVAVVRGARVVDPADWDARVRAIKLAPDPYGGAEGSFYGHGKLPNAHDAVDLALRHIPIIRQEGEKTFRLLVGHVMAWLPPEERHTIDSVWVTKTVKGTEEIIYFADLQVEDTMASFELDFESLEPSAQLTAFAVCNLHGRWVSNSTKIIPQDLWEFAHQAVLNANVSDNSSICEPSTGLVESFEIAQNRHISFQLLDKNSDFVLKKEVKAQFLQMNLSFPVNSFFGIGFGQSMLNTDMTICTHSDTEGATCRDYFTTSRVVGPVLDEQLGSANDVWVLGAAIVKNPQGQQIVEIACKKSINANGKHDSTLKTGIDEIQDLVFAFGSYEKGRLIQHKIDSRGYVSLSFRDVSGTLQASVASETDKRDLKVTHGVLMFTIWGINVCIGAMIARYQRHTTWWLGAHRVLQSTSTILTLPAFLLTRKFTDERPLSSHMIVGFLLIYSSWIQSGVGMTSHLVTKFSKKVFVGAAKSEDLSAASKAAVKHLHAVSKGLDFFRTYHKHRDLLAKSTQQDLDAFSYQVVKGIGIPCVKPEWIIFLLVHFRARVARPFHRYFGLCLPVLAYSQMFLGLAILKTHDHITLMLIIWTALIGCIVLYKELELQFNLPHSVRAKLSLCFNSFSCRTSESSQKKKKLARLGKNSGAENIELATQPGPILKACVQPPLSQATSFATEESAERVSPRRQTIGERHGHTMHATTNKQEDT
mmetsp:Transcript_5759/g.8948  ORF Transcript_5759/g.8948 Transcript_5759/m.8948 type:complete len:716 (-) Transcript_5759:508-2655(-)|eukprot:CAMPEP_0203748390 /NCGR_PEP_ID=MMETSP0098-20131031/3285_1 /ASSEMBLY_ACC=CAM_ASM_000208 /TAXON_ID=96639 /ORGANISM=" , Strain NY0313808BC1" /LENGTH=715 /DNA_ID=CAMNT_0050637117 /DNA_START=931 /DNA_END=3078 /DNA_ORIENTATION=+